MSNNIPEKDLIQLLKDVPICALLTEEELQEFSKMLKYEEFQFGAYVFKEDDFANKMYIIYKGEVRISKEVPNCGEETIVVLKRGDFFGEMSLLDDFPRSANAIANTTVKLLYLDRDNFDEIIFFNKDIAYKVLLEISRILAGRLRNTTKQMYAYLAMINSF